MYIYDGGVVTDPGTIRIAADEINSCLFVQPDELPALMPAKLARRPAAALRGACWRHHRRTGGRRGASAAPDGSLSEQEMPLDPAARCPDPGPRMSRESNSERSSLPSGVVRAYGAGPSAPRRTIRERRERAGLSQAELGSPYVTRSAVSRIEAGSSAPSCSTTSSASAFH